MTPPQKITSLTLSIRQLFALFDIRVNQLLFLALNSFEILTDFLPIYIGSCSDLVRSEPNEIRTRSEGVPKEIRRSVEENPCERRFDTRQKTSEIDAKSIVCRDRKL